MGRGASKASQIGGGGTIQNGRDKAVEEANKNPILKDYDNIGVRVVYKDGNTDYKAVSIQTTASIDELEGVDYIAGGGRYREGNIYRNLASDATNNTLNGKDNFMEEPNFKEGKWTKTDAVPVTAVKKGQRVLDKTNGYATKIDGETVYLQKRGNKFALNYMGNIANIGGGDSTLAVAKERAPQLVSFLKNNKQAANLAKAQYEVLNKNKGAVSNKVWKEINLSYIANNL